MLEKYWDGKNWLVVKKSKFEIKYYLNGDLHRNDGPAQIFYYFINNSIKIETYYLNGKEHRENGPALIKYNKNGLIISKMFFYYGKKHKENGPAEIWFRENIISIENYFFNDNLHKFDGPAFNMYDYDQSKFLEGYYVNGIEFNPDDLPFKMPIDTNEKELYFKLKYGDNND